MHGFLSLFRDLKSPPLPTHEHSFGFLGLRRCPLSLESHTHDGDGLQLSALGVDVLLLNVRLQLLAAAGPVAAVLTDVVPETRDSFATALRLMHVTHRTHLILSCLTRTCFLRVPLSAALNEHIEQAKGLILRWTEFM